MGRSLSRTERPVVSKGSGAATRFEPLGVDGIYGKPRDENVVQETFGRAERPAQKSGSHVPLPKRGKYVHRANPNPHCWALYFRNGRNREKADRRRLGISFSGERGRSGNRPEDHPIQSSVVGRKIAGRNRIRAGVADRAASGDTLYWSVAIGDMLVAAGGGARIAYARPAGDESDDAGSGSKPIAAAGAGCRDRMVRGGSEWAAEAHGVSH